MAKHTKTTSFCNSKKLSKFIKTKAKVLGFDACGICKADIMDHEIKRFNDWLKQKNHANMHYLEKHADKRADSRLIFENTKSLVVVLKNYYTHAKISNKEFSVSKYAYGKDYHEIIKNKLNKLLLKIKTQNPAINGRSFVDTAPILERSNAVKAGLGVIGKNKCLIHPSLGSFTFIGILALDTVLNYDKPVDGSCKNCKLCIDSCPTKALTEQDLNANKCISYHTIENKGDIPNEVKEKMTSQIFGCDICQDVCPYNKGLREHNEQEFKIYVSLKMIREDVLKKISDSEFKHLFKDSPLIRAGRKKILENIKAVRF